MQTSRHDHPRDASDGHDAERVLTELDHVRLSKLLERAGAGQELAPADSLLDQAEVVAPTAIGPGIVTMNSRVRLRLDDGTERELTLCYPRDAQPGVGYVSVLSPFGLGLLGQRVGNTVEWAGPDGRRHRATLDAIVFQPEASGDFLS